MVPVLLILTVAPGNSGEEAQRSQGLTAFLRILPDRVPETLHSISSLISPQNTNVLKELCFQTKRKWEGFFGFLKKMRLRFSLGGLYFLTDRLMK